MPISTKTTNWLKPQGSVLREGNQPLLNVLTSNNLTLSTTLVWDQVGCYFSVIREEATLMALLRYNYNTLI